MLKKITTISKLYPNNQFFLKLYNFKKTETSNYKQFFILNDSHSSILDPLIIGNTFNYLVDPVIKTKTNPSSLEYYLELLACQFLSFKFNLK